MAGDYYGRTALYRATNKRCDKTCHLNTWTSMGKRENDRVRRVSRIYERGGKRTPAIEQELRYHARVIIRRVNDKIVSQS